MNAVYQWLTTDSERGDTVNYFRENVLDMNLRLLFRQTFPKLLVRRYPVVQSKAYIRCPKAPHFPSFLFSFQVPTVRDLWGCFICSEVGGG